QRPHRWLHDAHRDAVEIDLRPPLVQLDARQLVDRDAEAALQRDAFVDLRAVLGIDVERAGRVEYRRFMPARQRLPFGERRPGPARVKFVAGIFGPDQPRLAARRGPVVRGAPRIEQQHSVAAALQVPRGPGAEHPGTNYDEIRAGALRG